MDLQMPYNILTFNEAQMCITHLFAVGRCGIQFFWSYCEAQIQKIVPIAVNLIN